MMVELHSEARSRYLNLLAMCHGIGSLFVPLYVAWLVRGGGKWQQIYCSSIFLAIPLLVFFWPSSRINNAIEIANAKPTREEWDWKAICHVGFTKRMNCYYALIVAYVAVELGVAAWMMVFLQRQRAMSVNVSSIYLSSFFVLLMLGRLLGAFVVERLDHRLAVFVAIMASSLCLLIGIFGNDRLVVFLPISGLFMSIVFPTVTAAVTKMHPFQTGSILGFLFTFGGLGGALGPWTVGIVSEWAGLDYGLASTVGFALVALGAILCLRKGGRNTHAW